ncbi:MAG: FlgO family outer membrane protein [Magnetococcus sp. WYHC-3]
MSGIRTLVPAVLLAGLALGSGGCFGPPHPEPSPLVSQPLSQRTALEPQVVAHQAADIMLRNLDERMENRYAILPTTFVNQDNLDETSPLGRMIAKQMASRFAQAGYKLYEPRLRTNLLIQQNRGEFILSQELEEIARTQSAQAVLAGDYAVARGRIFVTARLIRLKDRVILTSHDFVLPIDSDVRALMHNPS